MNYNGSYFCNFCKKETDEMTVDSKLESGTEFLSGRDAAWWIYTCEKCNRELSEHEYYGNKYDYGETICFDDDD